MIDDAAAERDLTAEVCLACFLDWQTEQRRHTRTAAFRTYLDRIHSVILGILTCMAVSVQGRFRDCLKWFEQCGIVSPRLPGRVRMDDTVACAVWAAPRGSGVFARLIAAGWWRGWQPALPLAVGRGSCPRHDD
jgi:hypothetical protein